MFSAQEVVTNEHVVAMMKAAIQETQDLPLFVSQTRDLMQPLLYM